MDFDPGSVWLAESNKFELSLVSVTGKPSCGAGWLEITVSQACRFLPTTVWSDITKPGMRMFAVNRANWAAATKPGGTLTANVVVPGALGWSSVVAISRPPGIFTCVGITAAMLGSELVTSTLTVDPPATGWLATKCIEESSNAE